MRAEFALQLLSDLPVILRLISGNGIDQFIQDNRVTCDPVTDLV